MAQSGGGDPELQQRLQQWFRETLEIDEERRIARLDDESIIASKLPPGAAALVYEVVDKLPEILDADAVRKGYEARASEVPPEMPRVQVWFQAMALLLRDRALYREIPSTERDLVQPGIDSVAGVLDAVLWTQPTVGDADYAPNDAERAAFLDATERIDGGRDIFTRVFGIFEGRHVLNVCPGAPFARTMLDQAWTACTGAEPPVGGVAS